MSTKGIFYRQSSVRRMTECESAWVGAMIEGEGTIHWGDGRWLVAVYNTDVEVISTVLRFVGDGTVALHSLGVNRPSWLWRITNRNSLRALAEQVAPWMTVKGDRLREAAA